MATSHSYRTTARWTEHKRGIVDAEGVPRTVNFASPPEFGGEPSLWTPEHLLLASVGTCYKATWRAVADASKAEFHALELELEATIEKQAGRFCLYLRRSSQIPRKKNVRRMGRLAEKAERICLVSRSLACPITLHTKIVVQPHVHA